MEIYGKFDCISGCSSTLNHLVVLPSGDLTVTEGTVDLSGPTLIEGVINIVNNGKLTSSNDLFLTAGSRTKIFLPPILYVIIPYPLIVGSSVYLDGILEIEFDPFSYWSEHEFLLIDSANLVGKFTSV
ncbi:hypothetical protein GEMRC1_005199 [Eukaryota sp. GEM-RC1]